MIKLVLKAPEHCIATSLTSATSGDAWTNRRTPTRRSRPMRERGHRGRASVGREGGGEQVRRCSASEQREGAELQARAQGYFIRNSETLLNHSQRLILNPEPGRDTRERAEDNLACPTARENTKKMVDILVPTAGPRPGATTATVKTVVTESGPQQVIVIPQSLFQQANVGSPIQKQQQKPVIRISPAATSPSTTARAALKRSIKVR